jgi:CRISPR/Cas system-associated exonuclease Cas4 (RecB family)
LNSGPARKLSPDDTIITPRLAPGLHGRPVTASFLRSSTTVLKRAAPPKSSRKSPPRSTSCDSPSLLWRIVSQKSTFGGFGGRFAAAVLDDAEAANSVASKLTTSATATERRERPSWTGERVIDDSLAHRAIQLILSWRGEPNPTDLVDEAMARLADEERGIGQWIAALSPADEADLRGQSVERVTKFMECFPPLDKRSNPMTESSVRWPNDGPIVLSGKVDLVMGRPRGSEASKVIVDLKTGRPSPRHRQDLGFYALLETLSRSVPPRKLATFYLDAAEAQTEDVSERLLRSAVRRTLDAINAIVELESEGRAPVRRAGVTCRWCPLSDGCDDGQAFLTAGLDD